MPNLIYNYNRHDREVGTRYEDSIEFDVKNWFSQELFDDIIAEIEKTSVFELDDDVNSHKLITQATDMFTEFLAEEFKNRVKSKLINRLTFAGRSGGWLCVMVEKWHEDELPKKYHRLYDKCEAVLKQMKSDQRKLWKKYIRENKLSIAGYTETHYFVRIEPL